MVIRIKGYIQPAQGDFDGMEDVRAHGKFGANKGLIALNEDRSRAKHLPKSHIMRNVTDPTAGSREIKAWIDMVSGCEHE
jgi:hypothetical protein